MEIVKISATPTLCQHTWGDISDAVVTKIGVGTIIQFNKRDECITLFYGPTIMCQCGLIELSRF